MLAQCGGQRGVQHDIGRRVIHLGSRESIVNAKEALVMRGLPLSSNAASTVYSPSSTLCRHEPGSKTQSKHQ